PNKEEIVTGPSFATTQSNEVEDKQNTWAVSQCVKADSQTDSQADLVEKYKELIGLAMNGYNSAGLYLSIGPNYLYDNRRQSHEIFLELLRKAVKSSADPIQIEYVYLCITDDGCFDCRKDKWRTVSEEGIDLFMKRQLEKFKNNSSQLLELKTIQMQQKSLIHKAELGVLKSDMRKSKIDSIVFGAASSFKDIELFNIERENKRQKLDIESQAAIIEKYKAEADRNEHMIEKYKAQAYKNKDIIEKYQAGAYKNEDIEKYKEEAQRFQKLAQQSQKETLNLHREYKVEIEKLKEGFKEKALSFKEEVRRRMAEFQNAS
ncbi:hypothetical protein CU098_003028, partial [Rhizopus stolonifer]